MLPRSEHHATRSAGMPDWWWLCGARVCFGSAKAGLHVTVLESADRLLQRVTTPEMSQYFADLHRSHGVEVCCGAKIHELRALIALSEWSASTVTWKPIWC